MTKKKTYNNTTMWENDFHVHRNWRERCGATIVRHFRPSSRQIFSRSLLPCRFPTLRNTITVLFVVSFIIASSPPIAVSMKMSNGAGCWFLVVMGMILTYTYDNTRAATQVRLSRPCEMFCDIARWYGNKLRVLITSRKDFYRRLFCSDLLCRWLRINRPIR